MSSEVYPLPTWDRAGQTALRKLLADNGLMLDPHLDYTAVIRDDHGTIIASGSTFGASLRCLVVDPGQRGEGLLGRLVSHLLDVQFARGYRHVFLHTKPENARFFEGLGFGHIAEVRPDLVFMESPKGRFEQYLQDLQNCVTITEGQCIGGIVMNANPMTRGHLSLIQRAAETVDHLLVFVLSDDSSIIPFKVRKALVTAECAAFDNVQVLETGPYLISTATFPAYFLKSNDKITETQARLDCDIFLRIARTLGLSRRFVGEEPFSQVTAAYNHCLLNVLPPAGIAVEVLPRLTEEGRPISASDVRLALRDGNWTFLEKVLCASGLRYFKSDEGRELLETLKHKDRDELIHD